MTDAPERIWAWGYDGYQNVWGVQKPDPNHVKIVGEYIRADLHKQALDAARDFCPWSAPPERGEERATEAAQSVPESQQGLW